MRFLAAALLLLSPVILFAKPATARLDTATNTDTMHHFVVDALMVDDPSVVTAEVLPGKEILISPKSRGRARLFVLTDGTVDVLQIRVCDTGSDVPSLLPTDALRAEVKKRCPTLKEEGGAEPHLEVEIGTAACRAALMALFDTDAYTTKQIEVLYSEESIKAQLDAIQAAIKKAGLERDYQVGYLGATLRVRGKGVVAKKVQLLRLVWENTAGRVLLDDESELFPEPVAAKPVEVIEKPKDAEPAIIVEHGFKEEPKPAPKKATPKSAPKGKP